MTLTQSATPYAFWLGATVFMVGDFLQGELVEGVLFGVTALGAAFVIPGILTIQPRRS